MKLQPIAALGLALALCLPALVQQAGAQPAGAQPAPDAATDIVAQRGDVRVTVAQLQDMLSRMDPAQRAQLLANPQALSGFVRDRVLSLAVLADAQARGWDQRPEVKARAEDARNNVVVQSFLQTIVPADPNFPTEADVQAAYDANKARFQIPKQFHLAQIVVLVPPGAAKEVEDAARKRATELRAQAAKSGANFGEIARKSSDERSSADKAGDVGFLREDQLLPVVREAVVNMPEGAVSEPLRAPDGWHIVKMLGSKPATVAPLSDVQAQLVQALKQARTQAAVRQYLEDLVRKEPIQINEIGLARSTGVGAPAKP